MGLADGLRKLGKKSVVALREPSLGPVFGTQGRGCRRRLCQVVPMEDINLHFTGDFHAIGAANNCWPPCWTTIFSRATPWGLM